MQSIEVSTGVRPLKCSLGIKALNCSTAFTSNAVSICVSISLTKLTLVDVSARYLIHWEQDGLGISPGVEEEL